MFSEGVIDLVNRGVVTNSHKALHKNVIASSFVMGSKRLYDFIDDNPEVQMLTVGKLSCTCISNVTCFFLCLCASEEVNNPTIIKQNPRVTAINSCIELDLTGQVCADSIGSQIFSGVGGQMDCEQT